MHSAQVHQARAEACAEAEAAAEERFAAALARVLDKQARSLSMRGGWLQCSSLVPHGS